GGQGGTEAAKGVVERDVEELAPTRRGLRARGRLPAVCEQRLELMLEVGRGHREQVRAAPGAGGVAEDGGPGHPCKPASRAGFTGSRSTGRGGPRSCGRRTRARS